MKRSLLWALVLLLYAQELFAQSAEPEETSADDSTSGPAIEALSVGELEALGLEAEGPRVDTDIHFWGFVDFTSAQVINPHGSIAFAQGRHQNFYIGNLNLYLARNLSESFRTMAEVRLTYMPNGSFGYGANGITQTDTSTVDYANGQSVTRWGGIILQRIYLEWTLHRFLTVRGGQYLTPLGIWNVDHGSPAYIPAQRPLALTIGLFPERQMGIEAFGRWSANNENTLGYHLTLSNGTGPISEYKDLDRNKAVGGRVYWEYFGQAYVRGGFSGYYGRDTNATPSASITASSVELTSKINTQSDVLVLAADLLFKVGGLQLQTEWITTQRRYTEAGRVVHSVLSGTVARAGSADSLSWAGYALAAYRFSWYSLTPVVTYQEALQINNSTGLPDSRFKLTGGTVGLNVRPIDSIVFKSEFGFLKFPSESSIYSGWVKVLQFQAAWAF